MFVERFWQILSNYRLHCPLWISTKQLHQAWPRFISLAAASDSGFWANMLIRSYNFLKNPISYQNQWKTLLSSRPCVKLTFLSIPRDWLSVYSGQKVFSFGNFNYLFLSCPYSNITHYSMSCVSLQMSYFGICSPPALPAFLCPGSGHTTPIKHCLYHQTAQGFNTWWFSSNFPGTVFAMVVLHLPSDMVPPWNWLASYGTGLQTQFFCTLKNAWNVPF